MRSSLFLPPPQLLHQEPTDFGFGPSVSGNKVTRRAFIKRTGAVSVATLVASGLGMKAAHAEVTPPETSEIERMFWGYVWDMLFGSDEPSDPQPSEPQPSEPSAPPPPPPCEHQWQYFFEGEDNFSYWGYRKCVTPGGCGGTERFRVPKPNVA
jgi:hypothetical protein